MDTRGLSAFKLVYEQGSIAKAAEKLFITPQGLSKTIARLEGEFGCALFTRTAHGVEPTDAAHTLYPRVDEVVGLLDGLMYAMRQAEITVVRVAASSGYFVRFGGEFMRGFEAENPRCRLEVEEHLDDQVLLEVSSGRADCGFTPAHIDRSMFDVVCITRHPYVLLVAEEHPLASRSVLEYADLEGMDLVALGGGHAPFLTIRTRLESAGVRPAAFTSIIEITTGIDLARRGEAGCFITDFAASSFAPSGVVAIPFSDLELTWDLSFIKRRNADLPQAVDSLRDLSIAWLAEHRDVLFR